jgi:hypothetical protein
MIIIIIIITTPWLKFASDHRLSAKLVPSFADIWKSHGQRGGSL